MIPARRAMLAVPAAVAALDVELLAFGGRRRQRSWRPACFGARV